MENKQTTKHSNMEDSSKHCHTLKTFGNSKKTKKTKDFEEMDRVGMGRRYLEEPTSMQSHTLKTFGNSKKTKKTKDFKEMEGW